jgi:hypothetical protein
MQHIQGDRRAMSATEGTMRLPEDVRKKLDARSDKDEILEVMRSLEGDGVAITNDVYAAIVTTLRLSQDIIDN